MEYNFCDEIKAKYKVEELNSKTLNYRINGFIKACNMNLENSDCSKDISNHRLEYVKLEYNNDADNNIKYSIKFFRSHNENGNSITINGEYDDLSVYFSNYVDDDKYNRINELPFRISLEKKYNGYKYDLEISSLAKSRVKFIIRKENDRMMIPYIISFQANVFDFGIILKLVKGFVNNPEIVYSCYNDIIDDKKKVINCCNLEKGIIEDESLDEPVKGIKKFVRSLFK